VHCLVLLNDDTVGLQTGRLVQSTKIVLLVSASKSNIQDVCSLIPARSTDAHINVAILR
jgi:hypothetical protein